MKKLAVALAVLVSTASTAFAAEEGPLLLRLRGVYVLPADRSDAIGALNVPQDKITVSRKLIPEVDISWFFTPNVAAELILTYPQKHDVKVDVAGVGKIGTITELPPCLTVQWHFLPGGIANPYVGLGVNLTLITAQSLNVGGALPLEISKSSVGVVGQIGVDVKIIDQVYVNADMKWAQMGFDVKTKADGAKVSHVTVNPLLFAVGVGYRI